VLTSKAKYIAGVSSNFASCLLYWFVFFTLALQLLALVYLQQLRHFRSCRVVPIMRGTRSPIECAPWDEAVQELTMKSHSMPIRGEANFKYMVVHCYGDRHSLV